MSTSKIETWECPRCHKPVSVITGSGFCPECEDKGFWMDPMGGVHFDDPDGEFQDPAAMYE